MTPSIVVSSTNFKHTTYKSEDVPRKEVWWVTVAVDSPRGGVTTN